MTPIQTKQDQKQRPLTNYLWECQEVLQLPVQKKAHSVLRQIWLATAGLGANSAPGRRLREQGCPHSHLPCKPQFALSASVELSTNAIEDNSSFESVHCSMPQDKDLARDHRCE